MTAAYPKTRAEANAILTLVANGMAAPKALITYCLVMTGDIASK